MEVVVQVKTEPAEEDGDSQTPAPPPPALTNFSHCRDLLVALVLGTQSAALRHHLASSERDSTLAKEMKLAHSFVDNHFSLDF
jgi:hypothetical protein